MKTLRALTSTAVALCLAASLGLVTATPAQALETDHGSSAIIRALPAGNFCKRCAWWPGCEDVL